VTKPFRPMRSGDVPVSALTGEPDLSVICYPVLVSPKIDGIRCLITENGPVTRSLKPIRNDYIRNKLAKLPVGFDGEITVGKITSGGEGDDSVMNRTSSGVMRKDGEPDFIYHVFDDFSTSGGFADRQEVLCRKFIELGAQSLMETRAVFLAHTIIDDEKSLRAYEKKCVDVDGFEGIMLRSVNGPYKYGESTTKEGYLLKWKRWKDAEAWVIGAKEEMANNNEAKKNALGLTERSTHKDNKTPKGVLGKLVCMWHRPPPGADPNAVFEIGSGFTKEQRADLWEQHKGPAFLDGSVIAGVDLPVPPAPWMVANEGKPLSGLWGRLAKFKYQEVTPDGVPRFPVFIGFRDFDDLPPEG
jgi:DNA ligase-1